MRRILSSWALLLLFAALVPAVYAQEEPGVETDTVRVPIYLPGRLDVEVPEAERQQMTGGNAPAAVVELPDDRQPLVQTYRQSTADLPSSPLHKPAPPSVSALADKRPSGGEAELSAGRYLSRIVRGVGSFPMGKTGLLTGEVDYRGSSGHEPDPAFGQKSEFDAFRGMVGVSARARRIAAGATLSGFSDSWKLFGLLNGPARSSSQGALGGWVEARGDAPLTFRTAIDLSSTTLQTKGANSFGQSVLSLDSDIGTWFVLGRIGAGITLNQGSTTGTQKGTISAMDARGTYGFLYRRYYQVTLGMHLMRFDADYAGLGTGNYMFPEARVEFYPVVGMRVFGQNVPSVTYHTWADLYRRNPYLADAAVLMPTVKTIDAQGGVNLFLGSLQVSGRAGLQNAPRYLYFTTAGGQPTTAYGEARIVYIAGDLSMVLPGGFNAMVSASMRDGDLSDLHRDIPYYGALTGSATLSYSFADDRGLLQTVARYESSRKIATDSDEEIGAYLDLDVLASYYLTPMTGIIARVENAWTNNLEQWRGYPQPPAVFTLGATMRW